jgi:hypothetical protein
MKEESFMVLEKSRPALEKLSQLAPQLNKATDLYTAELKEIEASLAKLNLGIEVELEKWIQTTSPKTQWNDDGEVIGDFRAAWTIGYGRIDDVGFTTRWGFVVREYEINEATEREVEQRSTALMQCSRDLRIAAAERIPDLLQLIEAKVKEKIEVLAKISDKR